MKKSLLLLGVAVAAITSCTNDEVLEMNPQTTISFDGHVNKGTRAVEQTTTGKLETFYVFGGYGATYSNNVFNNEKVYLNGSWVYDGDPRIWTKNVYTFAAYANGNTAPTALGADEVSFDGTTLKFTNYVANDANDLVAALASQDGSTNTNQVNFTFNHLLSKIKFTFANNDAKYKMVVSDVTVTGVKNKATCSFTTSGASWSTPADNATLSFAGATVEVSDAHDTEDHMVIPGQTTTSDIKASFTVTFLDASNAPVDVKTWENVSLSSVTAWVPGYSYNYTASLSAKTNEIKFGVTEVKEWAESSISTPANNK